MINRNKYIYNFLPEIERQNLGSDLIGLENQNNNYFIINFAQEMIEKLTELSNTCNEPIVIQIISHGNCDGFGIAYLDNFVNYSDIIELLRTINTNTNNELILNLMTVCCSVHQLNFFNNSPNKIFKLLIGSIKGAAVHGSIRHSIDVNNSSLQNLQSTIEGINENLCDDFCIEKTETYTYLIV
jgi:hypothetical protein